MPKFQVQPIQNDTQRKVAKLACCAASRDRHDCVLYDTNCSTDSMTDILLLRSLWILNWKCTTTVGRGAQEGPPLIKVVCHLSPFVLHPFKSVGAERGISASDIACPNLECSTKDKHFYGLKPSEVKLN